MYLTLKFKLQCVLSKDKSKLEQEVSCIGKGEYKVGRSLCKYESVRLEDSDRLSILQKNIQ